MKSKFEKYIESQRHNLDIEDPDDNLIWDGINKDLNKTAGRWQGIFWKAAAIIIFLVSSTYMLYNEFFHSDTNIYNITLSEIDPAYSQQVINYRASISEKWLQVNELKPDNMEKLEIFLTELDDLEKMNREYQEDFLSYGYNERLVKAMLDYYDKRMRVLDRMLMEIQKNENYEKRNKVQTEI